MKKNDLQEKKEKEKKKSERKIAKENEIGG